MGWLVRAWRRRGQYVERAGRAVVSPLDPYRAWIAQRAPEVDYNATVLHRELGEQGFTAILDCQYDGALFEVVERDAPARDSELT